MVSNSTIIISLCSQLCTGDGIVPLEPREWSNLAEKMMALGMQPANLMDFSEEDFSKILGMSSLETERMQKLLNRTGRLSFELADLDVLGVHIVTRADREYPQKLKAKLKNHCPPLFYYAGNLQILNSNCAGFVGSRSILPVDADFAKNAVNKTLNNGYTIVSGGAKGVDSISTGTALMSGGRAIEFLADSMLRRYKNTDAYDAVQDGRLLLISLVKPSAGFNVGNAMARNKFIYAQADGVVVVKSDYNKGGTWSGATDNLKNGWSTTYCWNNAEYQGNQAIIQKGAIPIDDSWEGILDKAAISPHKTKSTKSNLDSLAGEQISLFN